MTCPFCGAGDVERVGQWGGQIITAQWRCRACGSYFEAVRDDFDDARDTLPPRGKFVAPRDVGSAGER